MAFELVELPQPPLARFIDPEVPGIRGYVVNEDAAVEFDTQYGQSFLRCPVSMIPGIVAALNSIYAVTPVIPPEEPTDPEGPIDVGTGEETPVDEDVLVNPIDNGNVGSDTEE